MRQVVMILVGPAPAPSPLDNPELLEVLKKESEQMMVPHQELPTCKTYKEGLRSFLEGKKHWK